MSEQKNPTDQPSNAGEAAGGGSAGRLAGGLVLYTIARFGLVAVLAALIIFVPKAFGLTVPLMVALPFAVLIALPLGMFLFKSLRMGVNGQIDAIDAERRRKHDDLQSRLRGES